MKLALHEKLYLDLPINDDNFIFIKENQVNTEVCNIYLLIFHIDYGDLFI
jgi:hypothetical protein